jgi:hypothetical protein
MKKIVFVALAILFIASSWMISQDAQLKGTKNKTWPFVVYTDSFNKANHYIPSGWMGDFGDIKITDKWATNPKTGKTCLQIKYTAERKQSAGWAGIYWQNPANNWGTMKGGYDLTGAKQLTFWARGEKGGELIEFKCGGIAGEYPDSAVGTTGPIEMTKDWQMYAIELDGEDLSYINGGFCVVFSADSNPDGMTFYIDEIQYATNKMAVTKTPSKK